MIAVFPWEPKKTSGFEGWVRQTTRYNGMGAFLGAWVLKRNDGSCMAQIFTSISDTFIRQEFQTVDVAKQFVDKFLEKNNIRTLPVHMMVLK